MSIYSFALFLHIAGTMGFFITLGLEWTGLHQIRNAATSEQVRAWTGVFSGTRRLGMASMLMIVISGFHLMASSWGWVAWIIVTLVAMVVMVVLINTLTRPRTMAMGQSVVTEADGVLSLVHSLAYDPRLWISIQTRLAISLGIVFLMTVKPGMGGSLLIISVAIALGLASSLPRIPYKDVLEKPDD